MDEEEFILLWISISDMVANVVPVEWLVTTEAVGLWPSWGFWVGEERETEQETEAVSAESGLFSQTLDDARTTTKVAENLSLSGENKRRKTRAISLPFLAGRSWSSFLILGVLKSPRKDPKALVPRIGPLSHETP
ncbi:hypothetical protein ACOSQ4_000164 [Xanthoceras sorbifolium]